MKLHMWMMDLYEIKNDKTLLAGYSFGGTCSEPRRISGTQFNAARYHSEFGGALPISERPSSNHEPLITGL